MRLPVLASGLDLVAGMVVRDLVQARHAALEVWRDVRRYDPPTQAALYAAHAVLKSARDPAHTALAAVAPGQVGSPEMYQWVRRIEAGWGRAQAGEVIRMNPVHTLHAVDNLALSALALAIGARGYGVGLGGAPGQSWAALDLLAQRLRSGPESEGLLFVGDQADAERGGVVCGVALLFARGGSRADALARLGSWDRLPSVVVADPQAAPDERDLREGLVETVPRPALPPAPTPDLSLGLATFWEKFTHHGRGSPWAFPLPAELVDGRSWLMIRGERP